MFIDEEFAKHHGLPLKRLAKPIPVFNVDGTLNKGGIIHKQVTIKVEIDGRSKDLVLLATALDRQNIILGYTWLEDENPDIDWRKNTLIWRMKPYRNIYAMIRPTEMEEPDEQQLVIPFIKGELTPQATEDWVELQMSHSQLFEQTKKKDERPVEEIIPQEFHAYLKTVFAEQEIGHLPKRTTYDHAIDLVPDFVPKHGLQFRTNPKEDAEMYKFIKENKAKGFIQKSNSPQAASLFFVPKKDGKLRPVQDYRDLNKQMHIGKLQCIVLTGHRTVTV